MYMWEEGVCETDKHHCLKAFFSFLQTLLSVSLFGLGGRGGLMLAEGGAGSVLQFQTLSVAAGLVAGWSRRG